MVKDTGSPTSGSREAVRVGAPQPARRQAVAEMLSAAQSPAPTQGQTRLTVQLGSGNSLEVWDDHAVAAGHSYPFDDWFGARLVPDPRAPLTVEPPLAVSLLSHDARWATYVPPVESDAVRVIAAIREACQRLGIEPIGIDDAVHAPKAPTPVAAQAVSPSSAPEERTFNAVEAVLLAIVHLSVFFFPVALPVIVWRILSRSGPGVAIQAKEAAEFQGVLYMIALPTVVYTARLAAAYGLQPAALLGFVALAMLLALAVACSFAAARQAMRGRAFSYRSLATAGRGAA